MAAERVVEHQPGADVRALPVLGQRQQERHRRDQVRRQHVEQQPALAQRLADEPEVLLLEVAQAAVDELARPRARCRTAKSRASTSATFSPRVAASSAQPAPVAPPPITTTSKTSFAIRSSAARRCSGRRLRSFERSWGVGVTRATSVRRNPWLTTSARSTRARRARASSCSTATGRSSPSTSASTSRSRRKAGWVEHDAKEVWRRTREVIGGALANSDARGGRHRRGRHHQPARDDRRVGPRDAASRSTTRSSGRTRAPTRSCASCGDVDQLREATGLPLSTYFSGPKIKWILDNVDGARERAENGELAFGTMDTWVIWNLTGGECTSPT